MSGDAVFDEASTLPQPCSPPKPCPRLGMRKFRSPFISSPPGAIEGVSASPYQPCWAAIHQSKTDFGRNPAFSLSTHELPLIISPTRGLVFALPSAPLSPCAHVYLLLGSSPFQTILTTGTLLSFTRLTATDLAYEGSEKCHGDPPVAVRAFKHFRHYPKQLCLCQGGIVESEPFSGSRRVFAGRPTGV